MPETHDAPRSKPGDRAPRQAAVALKYAPATGDAPRVTAKGHGDLAARIIEEARKAGVPIREDRDLVGLLLRLDLDQEIPAELYVAVAEILCYVYRINEEWKADHGPIES